jgi:signal transduction histidine kinase
MNKPIIPSSPPALASAGRDAAAPLRVLLIEDNIGFAYLIKDVLCRRRDRVCEVHEAHTLAAGLETLGRVAIDVILLDLGLPDSARMETFSRTRARAPCVPIIVLTVLDDDDMAMAAMRGGAQDYLVKEQVNKQLLDRSIRYAVERARADNALHELSARLLDLQDAERRRIARDLHDSTAQTLAALAMTLSLLEQPVAALPADARALLVESMTLTRQCSDELRTTAYLLHPPLLDELGLSDAVRDYCDGFARRSGIRVDLELPPTLGRLSNEVETTLFRMMQECLTNIHRHSGSQTASIHLGLQPSEIRMEVRDRGNGMVSNPDVSQEGMGVGIAGMRERVRQLGGRLEIETGPGGTAITGILPLSGGAL